MPYTNVWSDVIPAGTEQAKNIDNHIRQLRLDISERMNSLVEDWTADPLEPKGIWKGTVVGKQLLIPGYAVIVDTSAALDLVSGGVQFTAYGTIPLILPVGITITKLELLADRRGNASFNWVFIRKPFSAAAVVIIETIPHNIAGVVVSESGVLDELIDVNSYYYVTVATSASAKDVFALRVTYDTPDSRNTI